jgi:pimeloyl-ACP methyl ester carboxylesterase
MTPGDIAALNTDNRVESRVVEVDGVPMSVLVCQVPRPRAVVVALHGGAATARYFHDPAQPRLSLLETGAALGFTVIAPDRPGYGLSASHPETMTSPAHRADLTYTVVDRLLDVEDQGAGLFVLAHSAGCELAVRMAVDDRGKNLLGIELAGTGLEFHPVAREILAVTGEDTPSVRKPSGLQRVLWRPSRLYPPGTIGGAHFVSRAPAYEADVVEYWAARDFALLAREVRVPVHYTLGDHEMVWRNDPEAHADIAALFTASPRVVTEEQADSGHNLSVGLSALAYHLKILSFVEECVLAREHREGGR